MTDTKWVVSKYAPETGRRFEIRDCEYNRQDREAWIIGLNEGGLAYVALPRSEYIPRPAPERWEKVPIPQTSSIVMFLESNGWATRNERFRIVDGAVILERSVI